MVAIRVANELEQQALLSADRRFFTEPHYDGYPGGAGSPRSRHRLRARAVDPRSMAMSTEAVVGRNAVSHEEPTGSRPAVSAKPAPKKRPVKAARDANHGEAGEAKIDAAAFATSRCALCVLCVPSSEQMLRPCGLPTIRRMWAQDLYAKGTEVAEPDLGGSRRSSAAPTATHAEQHETEERSATCEATGVPRVARATLPLALHLTRARDRRAADLRGW